VDRANRTPTSSIRERPEVSYGHVGVGEKVDRFHASLFRGALPTALGPDISREECRQGTRNRQEE
ncbi:MAG TPA: hypothetical protein DIU48_14775, partial [Acidobacteria bacterium]|nr:hypothetical protein [Acidobacteriota bacterium]